MQMHEPLEAAGYIIESEPGIARVLGWNAVPYIHYKNGMLVGPYKNSSYSPSKSAHKGPASRPRARTAVIK